MSRLLLDRHPINFGSRPTDLLEHKPLALDRDVTEVVVGNVGGLEWLPFLGRAVEIHVVKAASARAVDDVNDAVRLQILHPVELLVHCPVVLHKLFTCGALLRTHLNRECSLVVVNVAAEDDVHFALLKDFLDQAHLLLALVGRAAVEARLVVAHEPPRLLRRLRKVVL